MKYRIACYYVYIIYMTKKVCEQKCFSLPKLRISTKKFKQKHVFVNQTNQYIYIIYINTYYILYIYIILYIIYILYKLIYIICIIYILYILIHIIYYIYIILYIIYILYILIYIIYILYYILYIYWFVWFTKTYFCLNFLVEMFWQRKAFLFTNLFCH